MDSTNTEDNTHSIIEINIPNPQCQIQEYNDLSVNLKHIHASFLFYRDKIQTELVPQYCQNIYTSLVKRIGGTGENQFLAGWKDLGYHLGVTGEELNYIENSIKSCPTDIVLKVFCQHDDSTFDKLIQALLTLNRLDAIEGMYTPLQNLLNTLIKNYEFESDHGYHTDTSKNEKQIIKPSFYASNLPEVLKRSDKNIEKDVDGDVNSFAMPVIIKPSVLLTYEDDGLSIAEKVSEILRNHNINIVSLESEKSRVVLNPEHFIRHYFDEVDYVIPILTEGYFQTIKSPTALYASSLDNTDCTYARFIYTLMSSHYINGNGCLNKKVRSILPQGTSKQLLADLYKYPILSVWIREDQLHKLLTTLF